MATFLLEVGTEELPASFVADALRQWQEKIPASLSDRFFAYEGLEVFGTPRRLGVMITGLPLQQPDQTIEVKGPALGAAYGKGGEPTKALLGFARSKEVSLSDLFTQATDKGEFVFARQLLQGRATAEVLPELALDWITRLEGKRLMRWGAGELKFPRPIRWLVALLNDRVLPLRLENLTAHRITYGHRVLSSGPIVLDSAEEYTEALRENFVLVDVAERREQIHTQMTQMADLIGAKVEIPAELLEEVTHLVEWPTAIVGEFEESFLALPAAVIKTEMISHQRYFPLYGAADPDRLIRYFITVSNGDPAKSKVIAAGNGRVIRARLSDGKFFYDTDRKVPLATYLPLLSKVTFQEQLGSVADKVQRIREICRVVFAAMASCVPTATVLEQTDRAASLCKADLVTQMVKEFPELQGVMGADYARHGGEDPVVAEAIFEHYLPRGASDRLPQSLPGKIVAISDRLDSLVGIFGLGIIPTGSSDPFALRRAATGIIQICWDGALDLNISQVLRSVLAIYRQFLTLPTAEEQIFEQLIAWFQQRCDNLLREQTGIDYDLVDAVLGLEDGAYTQWSLSDIYQLHMRAQFLQASRRNQTLGKIYEVVNRASRLAKQGTMTATALNLQSTIDQTALVEPAEKELFEALQKLPVSPQSYGELVSAIEQVSPYLAAFFEGVMVMAEDTQQKSNRLNMLGFIRNYSRQLADFSAIRS